jgi:hypothetical protein
MVGTVLLGGWTVVALLMVANPIKFIWILGFGRRPPLSERLVAFFRVLGVINAVGSAYILLTHYS